VLPVIVTRRRSLETEAQKVQRLEGAARTGETPLPPALEIAPKPDALDLLSIYP
jgi:hypothetical protein